MLSFPILAFLSLQQNELFKTTNAVLKKAERIMLLAFLYYITFGVFTLTTYSKVTKSAEQIGILSFQYLECEKNGRNNTCSDDNNREKSSYHYNLIHPFGCFPSLSSCVCNNITRIEGICETHQRISKRA